MLLEGRAHDVPHVWRRSGAREVLQSGEADYLEACILSGSQPSEQPDGGSLMAPCSRMIDSLLESPLKVRVAFGRASELHCRAYVVSPLIAPIACSAW